MARTFDAVMRAERARQQGSGPAPTDELGGELRERMASLEQGLDSLGKRVARELAESEERLSARMQEELRGLEQRRCREERRLALEYESRLEQLQRRVTRVGLALCALLVWIVLRL